MFKAAIQRCNIDPGLIQDICVGTVLPTRAPYEARAAAIAAGIPVTTPLQVINRYETRIISYPHERYLQELYDRFCSSGLMAVTAISNQIRSGQIDIGLAVGVEHMSVNRDQGSPPFSEEIMAHDQGKDCAQPMGWTSENVAQDFNISREDMDEFAALYVSS